MAAIRSANGCIDTDNNSTDFTASPPTPRNSSTTLSPCTAVPITLQDFSVNKKENDNELHWQVNCLSSSVTFELQRSADGVNFSTIHTSSETKARCASPFTYTDANALSGANYYRLKIVDIDGKVSYSKICLSVNSIGGRNILRVQPTIVSTQLSILYASLKTEKIVWVVTDIHGRILKKILVEVVYGDNKFLLAVSDLSSGQYQIRGYTSFGTTAVERFVKQ